ncbi:MAG: shikimate kinase [Candidatus Limimorpha sp.]
MFPDRIYIIGYMCSGKSSVSRKLAGRLGYHSCDTDDLFEERYHVSVNDFFNKYGEGYFRKFESEILKNTAGMHRTVVSTGGGTPCYFDNMEWMKENGKTVFIKVSPATVFNRLAMAKRKRPLVNGKTSDELMEYIENHYGSRLSIYEQADLIVKGENFNIDELLDCLEKM